MKTTIKNTFFIATVLVASTFLFVGCDSGDEFENISNGGVNIDLSGELVQSSPACLITDENNPSNHYSRVDSIIAYGFGMAYNLPDSLKDCDLKLIFTGKMRETESITGYLAIALHGKDSIYFWGQVQGSNHIKQINTWVDFKDSIFIPKTANVPSSQLLKVFSFKQIGKGSFDVDDLSVQIIRQ